MGLEVTGKLHEVFDTKQVTERFRKREFVVETSDNPRYPQFVLFQLTGDRCEAIEEFQIGDEVSVDFSVRGREWKSPKGEVKYFNSLDVWTIDGRSSRPVFGDDEPPPLNDPPEGIDDDLPF